MTAAGVLLTAPERHWVCSHCTFTDVTHEAKPHSRMHNCKGMKLLPIPMLDGGQIVYQSVEWIKGSPMSDRAQLLGQQVGIFAILLLMSFAFYNDIARLFGS